MKVGGPVIQHTGNTKYGQWLCVCGVCVWCVCDVCGVCVLLMTHLLLHNAANSEPFHEAGFDAYCCGYGELCHMMSHDVTWLYDLIRATSPMQCFYVLPTWPQ